MMRRSKLSLVGTRRLRGSYGRFFNKFSQASNQAIFPDLQRRFLENIPLEKMALNVDRSVLTRYASQQGVAQGYNPSKPG